MNPSDMQLALGRERAVRYNNLAALIRVSSRELKHAIQTGRPPSEITTLKAQRDAYFALIKELKD